MPDSGGKARAKAEELGAAAALTKPFEIGEVVAAVARLIAPSEPPASTSDEPPVGSPADEPSSGR